MDKQNKPQAQGTKPAKAGRAAEQSIWFDTYGVRFNVANTRYRGAVSKDGKVYLAFQMKGNPCPKVDAKGDILKALKDTLKELDQATMDLIHKVAEKHSKA